MISELKFKWGGRFRPASGSRGKHYRKSLILILFVSGIPGLIIGAIVYFWAGGRIESELHQLHNRQIEQRAHDFDVQLTNLEMTAAHWAFDPQFDYSLSGFDFIAGYEKSRDLTKTLLVMQGSNTLTKRVEMYVQDGRHILFNPEYGVVEQPGAVKRYEELLNSGSSMYWRLWAFDPSRPESKDLTLVHKIPGGSMPAAGAIIIRLDQAKMSGLLKSMSPYDDGKTFLFHESGSLIASENGSSEFMRSLQAQIASYGKGQGLFYFDWNHVTYSVSYGTFTRIGSDWMYVSAAPITAITAPVLIISKVILFVSTAVLLLALVLAWLASRSIYYPIERLVSRLGGGHRHEDEFMLIEREWTHLNRESLELHNRLEHQLPHVKESFLLQLIQGYLYAYSEQDLIDRMRLYRWEVDERQFVILYIRFTGFTLPDGRFSQGDEGLATFAAVNIIEELAAERFNQSNVLNFHDLSAGLLITTRKDDSYLQPLRDLCDRITQAINHILHMHVTIAVSNPTPSISRIPLLFEEAKLAVSYRIFDNDNQLIDMDRVNSAEDAQEPRYPFAQERDIIQSMRVGRMAETESHLCEFLKALSVNGAKEIDVQQGMLHLLGSIQHAILISGINPNRLFKGANMYELLSQIREPERILAWFRDKVIRPFMRELDERSGAQVKRMVEETMIYIQQNFMRDISLDNCADLTGTNPYFLSKTFKQVTGKNFIDYLTELRMERAKELLRESELKINDVAVTVGYQHSYFNRIFRKQEGMTPTQYRELSRAN
ncbi:helix-turn-helix domain-containing protein [Paenibacillus sp. sptzw28]|uniref:helix-turn-helix domain-containing protein n=1 Tax=Paenibacillus sp. sptzw28 TaxID=715179 RepID=UPI001C6DE9C8|nr:helix-turn-helix domain-containing protein [Paenibacillus sp. sptzw28]QYR23545.1 helix-turn-helix domain-containing protein [Paenibacillus sp. sptzw28]